MSTPSATSRSGSIGIQANSIESPLNRGGNSSNTPGETWYNNDRYGSELVECLKQPEVDKANLERTLSNSTVVDLSRHDIGEKGLERLCNALKANQSVTALILDNIQPVGQINWKGMRVLVDLLGANKNIKTLSLQNNRINDVTASSLMTGLIKQKSIALEQLNLNHNQIQGQTMECLSELLAANTTLTHLFLDHNRVDQEGVQALVEAISQPQSSLVRITLENNRLSRPDQDVLYEAVARSNDQRSVDNQHLGIAFPRILSLKFGSSFDFLSQWKIGAHNAEEKSLVSKAMAGMLLNNAEHSNLVNLCAQLPPEQYTHILQCSPAVDRSDQKIDKPSLKKLFELLKSNKSLTTLTLRNVTPPLNAEDVPTIIDFIKSHQSLTTLDLGQNEIGSWGAITIIEALSSEPGSKYHPIGSNSSTEWQSPIQTLCLAENQISQWTRQKIFGAVWKCRNLTCLDLRNNILTAHVHPDSKPDQLIGYEPMQSELTLAKQGRNEIAEQWKTFTSHSDLTILTETHPEKIIGGIHTPPRTGTSSTNVNDPLWHNFRVFGVIPLWPSHGRRSTDPVEHLARCTLEEGQSARLPWLIKEANITNATFYDLDMAETKEFTRYFAREQIAPLSLKILSALSLSFKPDTWKSVEIMDAFLKALPAQGTLPLKVRVSVSKECQVLYPRFRELLNTAGCGVVLTSF